MKNALILFALSLALMSCQDGGWMDYDHDIQQTYYAPYIPITDTLGTTLGTSILKGTTWVLYKYRLETDFNYQNISDTIRFIDREQYYYGSSNQPHFYTLIGYETYYSLVLNFTRFGSQITCSNISKYSLESGDIQVARFKDNTVGSAGDYYYLFIKKIN
jgi:hypothetical protein